MSYFYAALVLIGLGCGVRYRFWLFLRVIVLAVVASIGLSLHRGDGFKDGVLTLVFVQVSLQCGYFLGVILNSLVEHYRRPPTSPPN